METNNTLPIENPLICLKETHGEFTIEEGTPSVLITTKEEDAIQYCAQALFVVYDSEFSETFLFVTDFSVDSEDGSLNFNYLAYPAKDNLDNFTLNNAMGDAFVPDEGENWYDYINRIAYDENTNWEIREVTISSYLRWETRGAFEYNEKTKQVSKILPVKRKRKSFRPI